MFQWLSLRFREAKQSPGMTRAVVVVYQGYMFDFYKLTAKMQFRAIIWLVLLSVSLDKLPEMFAVYLRIYWHLQWPASIDLNRKQAVIELF